MWKKIDRVKQNVVDELEACSPWGVGNWPTSDDSIFASLSEEGKAMCERGWRHCTNVESVVTSLGIPLNVDYKQGEWDQIFAKYNADLKTLPGISNKPYKTAKLLRGKYIYNRGVFASWITTAMKGIAYEDFNEDEHDKANAKNGVMPPHERKRKRHDIRRPKIIAEVDVKGGLSELTSENDYDRFIHFDPSTLSNSNLNMVNSKGRRARKANDATNHTSNFFPTLKLTMETPIQKLFKKYLDTWPVITEVDRINKSLEGFKGCDMEMSAERWDKIIYELNLDYIELHGGKAEDAPPGSPFFYFNSVKNTAWIGSVYDEDRKLMFEVLMKLGVEKWVEL
ncbi:hypothetical protein B0O99DRAFT_691368 [Bisporella sp. PMI_857]|nr:hypothetical protein B0O99DRAFT_691368 [Bisporella sp. PMI_857]